MTTTTSPATHSVRFINAEGVDQKVFFGSHTEAWAFFKKLDAEGVKVGFPNWEK